MNRFASSALLLVLLGSSVRGAEFQLPGAEPKQKREGVIWSKDAVPVPERPGVPQRLVPMPRMHPWAGRYFAGRELSGPGVRLDLAPNFKFYSELREARVSPNTGIPPSPSLNLFSEVREFRQPPNGGSYAYESERIVLHPARPFTDEQAAGLDTTLYIITWGERRYLIPESKMVDFCNDANAGVEPVMKARSQYLLREGDEAIPTTGKPIVPDSAKRLLLEKPLEATVLLVRSVTNDTGSASTRRTTVVLDVGYQNRAFEMMKLHLSDSLEIAVATIRKANATNSVAEILQFGRSAPLPEKGWKFSTSQPQPSPINGVPARYPRPPR